jgi:predicted phage tail protein
VVDLSWNAALAAERSDTSQESLPATPANDAATGYRIEVGTSPGQSDVSTFTTGVTTTFTVGGLAPGSYHVRVRAFNEAGDGPASNEVRVTIPDHGRVPWNLTATVSGRTVRLAWEPPTDLSDVTGYLIEVGSAAGQADLAVVAVNGLSLVATSPYDGTFFVRVRAMRASGATPASNEVTVTVGAGPAPPCAAPGAPRALTGNASGSVVQLAWQLPSSGAPIGYVIQVGSEPGASNLLTLPIDGSLTSFTSPAPDGRYFIRLAAVNDCTTGPP